MIFKKCCLLLIMLFSFFLFKIDASALDCYYDIGGQEVKITVTMQSDTIKGFLFVGENSTKSLEFYPINGIFANSHGNEFRYRGVRYINLEMTAPVLACPDYIITYYRNTNPFETYIYGLGSDFGLPVDVPIIEFSSGGAYIENGTRKVAELGFNSEQNENNNIYNYCIENDSDDPLCNEYLSAGSSFESEKAYLKDKTFNDNPSSNQEFIECNYKNGIGTNLKMKFFHGKNQHLYSVNGEDEKTTTNYNASTDYSACPGIISFGLDSYDAFSVNQTCNADESDFCFYIEGMDPTYSDNSSAIYHYIHSLNTGNRIQIKILKVSDQLTGKRYSILLNNQDITNKVSGGSEDLDPNETPYILKQGDFYTISSTLDGSYEEAYIYITKIHDIVLGGSGTLEKTCDNILGNDFIDFLNNNVFKIVYVAIPVLLIILTSFDLAKLVFNDEKEGIPGALKRFRNRVIAAFLIFLIPNIIIFIADTLQATEVKQCVEALQSVANK